MSISNISYSIYNNSQFSNSWDIQSLSKPRKAPPDSGDIFTENDTDGSGGLSQSEFQALVEKINQISGQALDDEELFGSYDEDGDGILSETETQTAMESNRPQGGPPPGGMGGMQGPPPGGMGMQGPPPGSEQIVSDFDEDESGDLDETELESLTAMINQATGSALEVADLLSDYDEDEDGVLSATEAQTALQANRPELPPGDMGLQGSQSATVFSDIISNQTNLLSSLSSYSKVAGDSSDSISTLLERLGVDNNYYSSGSLFSLDG